jgi:hypothetical protein
MRILVYIRNNYRAILKESAWLFLIIVSSNALINLAFYQQIFIVDPVIYFSFVIPLSIIGGIGMLLINKRYSKKKD